MMGNNEWVKIGRELLQESASMKKPERLALVRKRAQELELSSHTVGRFLVLADFLKQFGITPENEARLPIGVIEVIFRIESKDHAMSRAMLDELIQHGIPFREALRREKTLKESRSPRESDRSHEFNKSAFEKILSRIGYGLRDELRVLPKHESEWRVASVSSEWQAEEMEIAFISESDPMYLSKRGFRNFVRDIVLARTEYSLVVIDFETQDFLDQYNKYISHFREEFSEDIDIIGPTNDKTEPKRRRK